MQIRPDCLKFRRIPEACHIPEACRIPACRIPKACRIPACLSYSGGQPVVFLPAWNRPDIKSRTYIS